MVDYQGTGGPLRVLLVEDNPADADLTVELLSEAEPGGVDVRRAETLADAVAQAAEHHYDVVLLDLGLPDSSGMATLDAIMASASGSAVVVLSGVDDERVGAEAVARGAQDFVTKGASEDGRLLARSLRYAVERRALVDRVNRAELEAARERELRAMGRLTPGEGSPVTASMFGAKPIRESQPALFRELAESYQQLIEQAAARQVYKIDYPVSGALTELAAQLGFLRAGPRDVVELHAEGLRSLTHGVRQGRERLVTEEGRYLLLELMGQLVAYYRRFYPGGAAQRRSD